MLRYLQIGEPAFKIAGGVILFMVSWDMLTSKRQARKRRETTGPAPALAAESGTAEAGARTTPGKQHTKDTKDTSGNEDEPENLAIFPLAIPMLAGPAAIMSVMVVSADFSGSMVMSLIGYGALLAVMLVTGKIMVLTAIADRIIDPRLSNLFSRVTATILAALSVHYVIDGMTALQLIATP